MFTVKHLSVGIYGADFSGIIGGSKYSSEILEDLSGERFHMNCVCFWVSRYQEKLILKESLLLYFNHLSKGKQVNIHDQIKDNYNGNINEPRNVFGNPGKRSLFFL